MSNKQAQDAITEHTNKKHEPYGCGLSKWWWFGGPFKDACTWHDRQYDSFGSDDFDLKRVDKEFLSKMLEVAGSSMMRKLQAYFMYAVAHGYGRVKKLFKW